MIASELNLNLTRLSSLFPSGKALMVMYTPASSCSTHSLSRSLALLMDSSPDREVLVRIDAADADASIDEISVFAPLMLESLGVEATPLQES